MPPEMALAPPAQAVFLTGFMGTGKSTTGARLAERLQLPFVDTDVVVCDLAGQSIPDVFAREGEERFRALETEALQRAIAAGPAVIATGGGAMLRPGNVELMRAAGPIICLHASAETILRRTAKRGGRPLLEGGDPMRRITDLLRERQPHYARADYQVSAEGSDRELTLSRLVEVLSADRRSRLLVVKEVRVSVNAGAQTYPVHVAQGAYGNLGRLCPAPEAGTACAVVSTDRIAPLYAATVMEALRSGGWAPTLMTVPDGERSKTLQTVSCLYDRLVAAGVDGAGAVFALGGGVAGDVAGFVAATYRRGVRFAQLPTSLLAQVDAGVGGKVAVDHPAGKNLVGTFYHPAAVVIDSATLRTLPERELRSGLAEVIKHGAIADAAMFEYLEQRLGEFRGLRASAVLYILGRNCQIKAGFVAQDPLDRGMRACLNYGHTIGHAVERAAGDWGLAHGEAVAVGMLAEARLGAALGITSEAVVARLEALLQAAGLPTRAPGVDAEVAREALLKDKKIAAGRLRLPVVSEVGKVELLSDVDPELVCSALEEAVGAG